MTSTVPTTQQLGQRLANDLPAVSTVAVPSFRGASVSAPSQAGDVNVARDISATRALTKPMQYQFAEDRLTNMVSSDSRFMQEAKRTGLEQAATRGAGNSSIAAGAAMREALRAAAPIAQQDAGFTQTEYGRGMQAQYEDDLAGNSLIRDLDRGLFQTRASNALAQNELMRNIAMANAQGSIEEQRANAQLQRSNAMANADTMRQAILNQVDFQFRNQMAENDTFRQNWLDEQSSFRGMMERTFQTELGLNAGMLDRLGQAFVEDPEVYNPQVVSGMMNFFRGQASGIINQTISSVIGGSTTPTTTPAPSADEQAVVRAPRI